MPHRDQIPSQDPNKPLEVVEEEQLRAWALKIDGWEIDDIAKKLSLTRRTVQRRLNESILARELPTRDAVRLISIARQDRYLRMIHRILEETEELAPADAARLLSEARQLDREQRRVLGADEPVRTETTIRDADAPITPEMIEWVAEADAEAAAELGRVNGHG
jgi:hypothetical protein